MGDCPHPISEPWVESNGDTVSYCEMCGRETKRVLWDPTQPPPTP